MSTASSGESSCLRQLALYNNLKSGFSGLKANNRISRNGKGWVTAARPFHFLIVKTPLKKGSGLYMHNYHFFHF